MSDGLPSPPFSPPSQGGESWLWMGGFARERMGCTPWEVAAGVSGSNSLLFLR